MSSERLKEKQPKRLYRWTYETVRFRMPFTEAQSGWRRGGLFVISSVGESPLGTRWQISISYCRKPPADELCQEVLAEFDFRDAVEQGQAQEWTQEAFHRETHARHFEKTLRPDGEVN
jgi:hypothetical protein